MLEQVNGIFFSQMPAGKLAFLVHEVYKRRRKDGEDLHVSYNMNIPESDIVLLPADGGYVLNVKPATLEKLEEKKAIADEINIYPRVSTA